MSRAAITIAVAAVAALAARGDAVAEGPTFVTSQLSATGVAGSNVQGQSAVPPQLSPDGSWLAYVDDPSIDSAFELYSVRRSGGSQVRLSAALPTGITVAWFRIAGNGRVVYLVDQETAGQRELWSVPIGGPAAASVKLSPALPTGGTVSSDSTARPQLSADGRYVVFVADATTAGVKEIWCAPTDGSGPASRLSPTPASGGGVSGSPRAFAIAADSSRVAFTGKFVGLSNPGESLWSAPLDGSLAAVAISFSGGNLAPDVTLYAFTPDGSQILFVHDREVEGRYELYRRTASGGAGAQISPTSVTSPSANGDVTEVVISPDSASAAFVADVLVDSRFELWTVPLDGSRSAQVVSPPLVAGREVWLPQFSPDSSRVAFVADASANDVHDLWSAPVDGASSAVRINPALAPGQDVTRLAWSDDSERLVYSTYESVAFLPYWHLWSNAAIGPVAAAFEISTGPNTDRSVSDWLLTATDVLLVGDLDADGAWNVYRAPVDGSSSRTRIAGVDGEFIVQGMQLLDSAHVAFAVALANGKDRLREVAIADGATAWFLDLTPSSGPGVQGGLFWPTPVGHGAFWVGAYSDNRIHLWIADYPLLGDGFENGFGGFLHN